MKKLFALVLVLSSTLTIAAPVCNEIGTRSEGWYQNEELIGFDNCNGMEAKCMAIGTRGEGWYAVDKETGEQAWLIKYDSCAVKSSIVTTRSATSDFIFDCLETAVKVCRFIYDEYEKRNKKVCEMQKQKICTPAPESSDDTSEVQVQD